MWSWIDSHKPYLIDKNLLRVLGDMNLNVMLLGENQIKFESSFFMSSPLALSREFVML